MHRTSRQESYVTEGTVFKNLKRTTFFYRHERLHRRNRKEPVGAFVVATSQDLADGMVTAKRPLLIDWGATRGKKSWVTYLENEYGKTKVALTRLLRRKRIDAIVTIRRRKTYQIVLLNVPMTKDGVDAKAIRANDAKRKLSRLVIQPPTPTEITAGPWISGSKLDLIAPGEVPAEVPGYNEQEVRDWLEDLEWAVAEDGLQETRKSIQEDLLQWGARLSMLEEDIQQLKDELQFTAYGDEEYEEYQTQLETLQEYDLVVAKRKLRYLKLKQELLDIYSDKLLSLRNSGKGTPDKMVQEVFGSKYTAREILSLGGFDGLPPDGEYEAFFEKENDSTIKVHISGTYVRAMRGNISLDRGKVLIDDTIIVLDADAPVGLATRMMYIQILKGQELGVDRFECIAAGDRYDPEFNGYYTWARLGYNAPLSEALPGKYKRHAWDWSGMLQSFKEKGILTHISDTTPFKRVTIHDLMMTPEGRDWWKENGQEWEAVFDLNPTEDGGPSKSVQVFENYMREKLKTFGKPMHKWGSGRNSWEVPLTAEDEIILDWVWDNMLERTLLRVGA